jgi:chemotaxis protein CheD
MIGTEGITGSEIAEHGIVSLEYLMAEIVKLGGNRKNLVAKIFGAGYLHDVQASIIKSNVKFLHDYFSYESIPVTKEDLGGKSRREIMFNPVTGEVFRKIMRHNDKNSEFALLEKEYIDKIFLGKEIKTHYVLFE